MYGCVVYFGFHVCACEMYHSLRPPCALKVHEVIMHGEMYSVCTIVHLTNLILKQDSLHGTYSWFNTLQYGLDTTCVCVEISDLICDLPIIKHDVFSEKHKPLHVHGCYLLYYVKVLSVLF